METITREELEALALHTVSSTNYYDLCDNIDTMTDNDLHALIDANSDEEQEEANVCPIDPQERLNCEGCQ